MRSAGVVAKSNVFSFYSYHPHSLNVGSRFAIPLPYPGRAVSSPDFKLDHYRANGSLAFAGSIEIDLARGIRERTGGLGGEDENSV